MSKYDASIETPEGKESSSVADQATTAGDEQITADATATSAFFERHSRKIVPVLLIGAGIVASLTALSMFLPARIVFLWTPGIGAVLFGLWLAIRQIGKSGSAPLGTPYDDADDDPSRTRRRRRVFRAGLILVSLSVVWGLLTLFVLTNLTPIALTTTVLVFIWIVSAVLILTMIGMVAWQIIGLWYARRRQAAGAGLHVRIVTIFGVLAVFPAVLLAIFAYVSIDRGLDRFSKRTRAIIGESVGVANAYLAEHSKILHVHGLAMARDLEANIQLLKDNPEGFRTLGTALALERRLAFAYLVNSKGEPVLPLKTSSDFPFIPPTQAQFNAANEGKFGEAGIFAPGQPAQGVRGLKKLNQANVNEYKALSDRRGGVQMVFAIMYVVIALTLLLASIWIGLSFANSLVAPIRRLIGAAQDVSRGNLSAAVKVERPRSDMGRLSATFNRMTTELRNQRNALIGANTKLDERRRFTEAVLSGVTAGVIGVDANGVITLVNMSSLQMLHREERELIGKPIEDAIPEFAAIAAKAPKHSLAAAVQSQITFRREGSDQTFSVRVTQEGGEPQNYGFVITFDDITALAVAQRTTAWADVARRVAHEIKNPLTPIQLSAERIRRKYGSLITNDREVFDRCTDTIIRHVGDIGRMVDEFSAFARMPKPVFEHHDVGKLVNEAVVLFQMSKPEIKYNVSLPDTSFKIECDRGLLTQLVTNLVKNAGEAIESAKTSGQKGEDYKGSISASVRANDGRCLIEVTDNGCGLPAENRARLTEPYVTTREKGTGLGLAIVQRIAEQHDGVLELEDAVNDAGEVTGAKVRLSIPIERISSVQQSTPIDEQAKPRLNGRKGGETHGV
ncbi:MAG: PAS domain-containing sensor histidine kinase [Alphaproteobacteria bacterium]